MLKSLKRGVNKMLGVILSGGWGTRCLPATKTTNKHLLPVYTKDGAYPMIEYPISTLKNMGITDILIITSKEHCGIIVDYLGDGYERGLNFTYKIQEMSDPKRPPGIASALKLCKKYTGDSPFVVILGDNFYEWNHGFMSFKNNMLTQIKAFKTERLCGLFLKETDEWDRFGVAKIEIKKGLETITKIVEKPTKYVSNLAVTGMYIYTKDVYKVAENLKPSKRGELEISDINNYYVNEGLAHFVKFASFWSDMGVPESMIKTQKFINGD